MEFQSYNDELGLANITFKRVFDNIRISRTDGKGNTTQLKVHCVLGQRSRIMKNLENPDRRGNYKLPMIVINRSGFSRNGDRLNNLHNEVKYEQTSSSRLKHLMAPVPIDINYEVSIIAKYQADIDKIASNFMVFFNSDIYSSIEHPKYAGVKLDNQIIMSDTVTEEHNDSPDPAEDDIMTSTFSFTFKTYLFGGTRKAQLIHPTLLSTYLSSVVSSYIEVIPSSEIDKFQEKHPSSSVSVLFDIKPNQIDDFQKKYPSREVSANLTCMATVQCSSYVDDISTLVYDDVPIIGQLNFGFYNVPRKEDISAYMMSVDNELLTKHEHIALSAEISSGYYDVVDNRCTLAPFVDKLTWKIDETSLCAFPSNVGWYNDFDS